MALYAQIIPETSRHPLKIFTMNLQEKIIEFGALKFSQLQKLDSVKTAYLPIGKAKLDNGSEVQIIIKVVSEKHEFLYCTNYD